jgi:cell division cycle 20-like protein 1 (cofactor of APC complex)
MYTNNIKFDQTVKMSAKKKRNIQKIPYKILEAPRLKDDFYLNLIDWSQSNQIAVGLQSEVYLWSGCSSKV